jgi:hypothetical protein
MDARGHGSVYVPPVFYFENPVTDEDASTN